MSAAGTVDWSALLPANASLTEGNYTLFSSLCLFYYDFIITIPVEVRIFWTSRLTLASALYALTRYGFLLNLTLVALFTVRFTQDSGPTNTVRSCEGFYTFAALMNLFNFATVSAFVATRIFAIWGRNWPIAISVFLLGLVNPNVVPVLLALHLRIVLAPWPIWGCEVFIPDDDTQTLAVTVRNVPIIVSVIGITYELLCLVLTVWKTLGIYRLQRSYSRPATLTSLLLRDGSVYFLVMTALYVANISAALIPGAPSNLAVDSVFGKVLTPILTTHFIAQLRQVDMDNSKTTLPCSRATFQSSTFRPFTSVGASMSYDEGDYEDEAL